MSQEGESQTPPHARDTLITSEGFATKQITETKQYDLDFSIVLEAAK